MSNGGAAPRDGDSLNTTVIFVLSPSVFRDLGCKKVGMIFTCLSVYIADICWRT